MRARCFVVVLFLLGGGATAFAQSLGQAAQKEKEKRAAKAKESKPDSTAPKVITEEDLEAWRPAEAPSKSEAGGKDAGPSVPAPDQAFGVAYDSNARAQQEKAWRARAESARNEVRQWERRFHATEENEAETSTGPSADRRDVPPQRPGRTNSKLETAWRQMEELEEEARRSGIPPGWLR